MIGAIAFGTLTINLLVAGVFDLILPEVLGDPSKGVLFFPMYSYAILRSKVGGAVTTTARIRIGGNANHDDVMPLFTVPAGAQIGGIAMPPLVVPPFVPPNLRAGPISIEVERGAVGPTELTGEIMIVGVKVSG